jgi:hypothetical protein
LGTDWVRILAAPIRELAERPPISYPLLHDPAADAVRSGPADQRFGSSRSPDMALSETQQAEVNRRLGAFCEARVPPSVRNQVRVSFRIQGTEVVLFGGDVPVSVELEY